MRLFWLLMLTASLVCGCARNNYPIPKTTGAAPAPIITKAAPGAHTNSSLIVTPGQQLTGRLASVNPAGRFVIVTFPLGRMPRIEQRFSIYRNGLKVGEIKISGPQRDVNIAADIIAGECRVGDEVKGE